jgi:hypothetical protein
MLIARDHTTERKTEEAAFEGVDELRPMAVGE